MEHHHFERRVISALESIMSTLEDLQAAQQTLDNDLTQLSTDVQALLQKIGTLDPATQAALDAEVQALNKSASTVTGLDTQVNPPPAS